jgi:hypothetical protein
MEKINTKKWYWSTDVCISSNSESGLTGNIIVGLDSQSIIQLKLMLKRRDKEDKGTRL